MRLRVRTTAWLSLLAAGGAVVAQTSAPWVSDASKAAFPKYAVRGTLFGKQFTPPVVEVRRTGNYVYTSGDKKIATDAYLLSFRSGESLFAEQVAEVSLLTPADKPPDGRTYVVLPGKPGETFREYRPDEIIPGTAGMKLPWVQKLEVESNVENAEEEISSHFSENVFSLRLEFGRRQGGRLPGKVYLCAQDERKRKQVLAGSFTAMLK